MTLASLGLVDLWDGECAARSAAGQKFLVARIGEQLVVYEDRCPHLGVPLSEGKLQAGVLTCRAHEWQFDIQTGQSMNPLGRRLKRFETCQVGDELWVEIEKSVEQGR